jgi:hypothetical protein
VIDVKELGLSGYLAADWIADKHKLTFELTNRYLMAIFPPVDTEKSVGQRIKGYGP